MAEPHDLEVSMDRAIDAKERVDFQTLARLVGIIAFGLPIVLLVFGWGGACSFDSLSHYYYAPFLGGVFVIALAMIGTFLIAYRGESNRERWLATFAGLFAFAVAFFPTEDRGCELKDFPARIFVDVTSATDIGPVEIVQTVETEDDIAGAIRFFEQTPASFYLHFGAAALLFVLLAVFCLKIFTATHEDDFIDADMTQLNAKKVRRNKVYRGSGATIILIIVLLGAKARLDDASALNIWLNSWNATFWGEAAALWAFGVSWAVKGRLFSGVWADETDRDARAICELHRG